MFFSVSRIWRSRRQYWKISAHWSCRVVRCSDCQSKTHHFSAQTVGVRPLDPFDVGRKFRQNKTSRNTGKFTTEEALVCCLGGVCVQIFPYVTNDVCHQLKDRIVDRNPQVLRSSASNLDVPCDREYRTAGLGQALQTRRLG